jgi:uncharacterized protein YajQ (UPF0234 family)
MGNFIYQKELKMKIEYLIIIDSGNPFCRDKKSFDNFLQSNADITIQGKVFKHRSLEVEYELQGGETEADKNRFFHIRLVCKDESRIEEFQDLLRATKTLLHMASDKRKPQILWDDVSFYYSKKAYPLIHEIENLMRKLITKFMLTNVGLGWTKDAIPEDLKKSSNSNSIEITNNYLYETDFKDLSTFLFDEYRTLDIKALNEKIEALEIQGDEVSLNEFKGFLPKSNWQRYFREHVKCEGDYLKIRWNKLYLLRCKIAHNNFFTKDDFNQVETLVNEVKPKIQDAINNLDKVEVPEDEREELAEIVAIKTNSLFGEYIQKWKQIEKVLFQLCEACLEKTSDKRMRYSPMLSIRELSSSGKLEKSMYHELQEANSVRNIIVHESDHHFSPDELLYRIANLDRILDSLTNK